MLDQDLTSFLAKSYASTNKKYPRKKIGIKDGLDILILNLIKGSYTRQYIMYQVSGHNSGHIAWLREFPDKSSNFGLLYGHVYGP